MTSCKFSPTKQIWPLSLKRGRKKKLLDLIEGCSGDAEHISYLDENNNDRKLKYSDPDFDELVDLLDVARSGMLGDMFEEQTHTRSRRCKVTGMQMSHPVLKRFTHLCLMHPVLNHIWWEMEAF